MNKTCPKCGKNMVLLEYWGGDRYHYDGISEYMCPDHEECGYREGRWCGKQLQEGEVEPPFCEGEEHPIINN